MTDDFTLSAPPPETDSIKIATVVSKHSDGLVLRFAGEDPGQKRYKCSRAGTFNAGDKVCVLSAGGTYIVAFPIGNPL